MDPNLKLIILHLGYPLNEFKFMGYMNYQWRAVVKSSRYSMGRVGASVLYSTKYGSPVVEIKEDGQKFETYDIKIKDIKKHLIAR